MKRAALSVLILFLLATSCKLKDTATSVVTPSASSMTVTSPNGGESIKEGSSFDIKWTSDSEALLRIQYTVDNGSTWTLAADSIHNTGTYAWFPVPNKISNQCKIRVASVDGSVSDQSDNVFSIARNDNQSLLVKVPNGGEAWEAGTQKQIVWYSSGIDSVKIEYTTDNGNHWNFIGVDKFNTGVYFWSPLPNTPSSLAKIRVMDAYDSFPLDESDNVFTITPEQTLSITAPAGGENWLSGTDQKIQWVSENIRNVKLQYTTNGGADWTTIVESTPSIGYYTWQNIPQINSSQCKIRILDAADGQPNAVSTNNFTITNQIVKTIHVNSPNGGESFEVGTSKEISWTSTNISFVNIELTTNSGNVWQTIATHLVNTGIMSWTIPNNVSAACKIRVKDSDNATLFDESDALFTIKPTKSITVDYPNGNETFRAGDKVVIQWHSTSVDFVKISCNPSNGLSDINWFEIVPKTASSGSYETSFTVPSNSYKIRISDADDNSVRDESDGTFTVLPATSITVSAPNGGEHLLAGQTYKIQWSSINVALVKLEYTIDGEFSWHTIAEGITNNGYYHWVVPSVPLSASSLCRIKVSEYNASNPALSGAYDMSDILFSIHNGPWLQLLLPNGGESFDVTKGDVAYSIKWNSTGISNVDIEYSLNGGVDWQTAVTNYPSTGTYFWLPPQIPSSNALIRITDTADPSIRVTSASFFSLIFSN